MHRRLACLQLVTTHCPLPGHERLWKLSSHFAGQGCPGAHRIHALAFQATGWLTGDVVDGNEGAITLTLKHQGSVPLGDVRVEHHGCQSLLTALRLLNTLGARLVIDMQGYRHLLFPITSAEGEQRVPRGLAESEGGRGRAANSSYVWIYIWVSDYLQCLASVRESHCLISCKIL